MDSNEETECEKYEMKEGHQILAQYNTHHVYQIPTFKAGTEYSVKVLTTSDNERIQKKWKKVGRIYLGYKSQIQATYSNTDDDNTLLNDGYRVIKTFDLNTTDQLTFKFKNAPVFNRGKMFIYSLTQDDIKNKKIYINGIAGGFTYHDDKQMFISNQELILNDLEITIK